MSSEIAFAAVYYRLGASLVEFFTNTQIQKVEHDYFN